MTTTRRSMTAPAAAGTATGTAPSNVPCIQSGLQLPVLHMVRPVQTRPAWQASSAVHWAPAPGTLLLSMQTPNTDAPSFSFTTNLWYAYDAPGQSNPGGDLPAPEQGGIYGVDPLLGDPGGGDYSIDPASPAAGAGTTIDELTRDVVDVCYLDPPAIGARERPE